MKRNLFALLKSFCITVGLNILLAGILILFSRLVQEELGQALLFLSVSLLMTLGVCLFANISTNRRGILWAAMGISLSVHFTLSVAVTLIAGVQISRAWPGGGGNNLAQLLLLLMSLAVWFISVFTVTIVRSRRLGRIAREEAKRVKMARKGYAKEWQTVSPSRARSLAILQGSLTVLWSHLLTGLFYILLTESRNADTMLSYIAFPTLWALMAAAYGLRNREHRAAYTLSTAIVNLLCFFLASVFLTVAGTPSIKYRFILHLDSLLTEPFDNPEQLLALGIFLHVWVAMAVFGIRRKPKRSAAASSEFIVVTAPIPSPAAEVKAPVAETIPAEADAAVSEDTPAKTEAAAPEAAPAEAEISAPENAPAEAEAAVSEDTSAKTEAAAPEAASAEAEITAPEKAPTEADAAPPADTPA